jgi:hypothetical protein
MNEHAISTVPIQSIERNIFNKYKFVFYLLIFTNIYFKLQLKLWEFIKNKTVATIIILYLIFEPR